MHPSGSVTLRRAAAALALGLALAGAGAAAPSSAAPPIIAHQTVSAPRAASDRAQQQDLVNPLAGRTWGVYKGAADQAWPPYAAALGADRALLGKIALRPKAKWFGRWISDDSIGAKVADYIAKSTQGDPDVLVQMTVFRMSPWEHDACRRLPSADEQASYRTWTDRFAAAIGDAHVALVLQPDGPFALCAPGGSTLPSSLIAYSAQVFSALPNTSVYLDGGASDWPSKNPARAADFLVPAGIAYTRGFALNSTHYSSTGANIDFGTQLVAELAARGIPDKHFVVNTSSNGRPFTFNRAKGPDPDNAKVCAARTERRCVTLGIPPTADVASPRWHLSALHDQRALAAVDGYLWFGRPWLYRQADPFDLQRALQLARTTRY